MASMSALPCPERIALTAVFRNSEFATPESRPVLEGKEEASAGTLLWRHRQQVLPSAHGAGGYLVRLAASEHLREDALLPLTPMIAWTSPGFTVSDP